LLPYLDKGLDWLAQRLWDAIAELTNSIEGKYYKWLAANCRDYEGRGFNAGGLSLEDVYVPLKLSERCAQDIPQDMVQAIGLRQRFALDPQTLQDIGKLLGLCCMIENWIN
jgi:hypothetical protein